MKSKVSQRRVFVFIGAVALTTMLILGLNEPWSSAPGQVHSYVVHQVMRSQFRIAGPGCSIAMKRRIYDNPLIHDLMRSAISIAGRL